MLMYSSNNPKDNAVLHWFHEDPEKSFGDMIIGDVFTLHRDGTLSRVPYSKAALSRKDLIEMGWVEV